MFVKSHTDLSVTFPTVCVQLLRCPPSTIVEVAENAQRHGMRLLVEAGLGDLVGEFDLPTMIEVGEHRWNERFASLPFRLWGEQDGRTVWSLECSLDAAWLGPDRTYLSLSGQYDMWFPGLAEVVDRTLVHRVAELTAQQFVEIAVRRLQG